MYFFHFFNIEFKELLIFIGVGVGLLGRFSQINIKKFIAYSSVFNVAWILVRAWRLVSILQFLFAYGYRLLMAAIYFYVRNCNFFNNLKLTGLFRRVAVLVGLLSLGGVPPFILFFFKVELIRVLFFIGEF